MKHIKISIVSPVYLAENLVNTLVERLHKSLSSFGDHYEIILVEDGSPDKSWEQIDKICKTDKNVKGIKLSRNFGQHYAITAGLSHANGEWIVVMDCDLQDKPEEILQLFNKATEGYDIVYAQRRERQDNIFKKLSSKIFYKTFGYLTNSKQDASIANFGIYSNKVIKSVLSMKDHVRFFPTMVQWVGFKSTKIYVKHGLREEGESSYSWGKLIRLAIDNIISFSDKPLRLTIRLGLSIASISFLSGIFYLYRYLIGEIKVLGFASIIISIWFLSGLIIFILGIIGAYIGKTFDRVKKRPTYIISEKKNL
ncbi:glycosyltransferase family 2 protein [uncultured Aquimarina sp.]|uniref:glycosyltransferase family 2 protein n=1 Tax=uncultured Aquimarina sp. TaxID=575652 RepID=UPI00262CE6D4|nr:glycosyltransferase family 2 protein [uncultured Aquimarina sp.]